MFICSSCLKTRHIDEVKILLSFKSLFYLEISSFREWLLGWWFYLFKLFWPVNLCVDWHRNKMICFACVLESSLCSFWFSSYFLQCDLTLACGNLGSNRFCFIKVVASILILLFAVSERHLCTYFLIVVPFILVWIRVLYILISPFNSLFIVFADCCSIHWKRGDSVSCHALQKMWRTEPVLLGVQCGIKPLQFLPCHAEYQMSWHCIWSWWNAHSCKHNAFFWR